MSFSYERSLHYLFYNFKHVVLDEQLSLRRKGMHRIKDIAKYSLNNMEYAIEI